jgi:UPF0755 protein
VTDPFDLGLRHSERKAPIYRRLLQVPLAVGTSLLVVVGVVAAGVSVTGKVLHSRASDDYSGEGFGTVQVEVRSGQSLHGIGQTLAAAGVVKSVAAFSDAAKEDPQARSIQPGTYRLRRQMSVASALTLLETPGTLVSGRIVFPEGLRLSKAEQLITAAKSTIKIADIEAAIGRGNLGLPGYANGKVEGFLYPATYNVDSSTTPTALLVQMIAQFRKVSAAISLEQGAAKLRLTPYQVVTIASLIEAEVKRPQDFPQVAEVIINRLHKGMRLELDSTVNYALGTTKPFLSQSDIKAESPYNTYLHGGLPPTPIDSPGQAALLAALNPAQGNFLYFVTTDQVTGATTFTASPKEATALRVQAQANAAATAAGSPVASASASPSASASKP